VRPVSSLVHAAASWLLAATVLASASLTAVAAPPEVGDAAMGLGALAVVISGVAARTSWRRTAFCFGLLLLYFAHAWLAPITALGPVLLLALFGGAVLYAERASRSFSAPQMAAGKVSASGRGK